MVARGRRVQNWLQAVFLLVQMFILHHGPVVSMMMYKLARETTSDKVLPKTTATLTQAAAKSSSALDRISGDRGLCVSVCFLPQGCPLAISTSLSGQAQM